MGQGIFISVVIPTYNRAQQLLCAIDSVVAQEYRDFEIVVVDDGSTDDTAEKIESIRSKHSRQGTRALPIRYFYQPNQGQSAARNKAIAEATGNWIAFLDSDDVWLPEKLQWQVRAIDQFQGECGACFTDARLVDRGSLDTTAFRHGARRYDEMIGIVSDPIRPLARAVGGAWVQTLVARSDLIRKIGCFDPELHFGEDYDFLFRLALETAHCYVNQPLAVIERTNVVIDPTVAARKWDQVDFRLRAQQYMYEKWLKLDAKYPPDVRMTIIDNLRAVHSGWANWYLETAQFGRARRAVSMAMKYRMTPQLAVKWALTWTAPRIARKVTPKAVAI
jgi:glycosyltransferase involved in cell wall biosynthesis